MDEQKESNDVVDGQEGEEKRQVAFQIDRITVGEQIETEVRVELSIAPPADSIHFGWIANGSMLDRRCVGMASVLV